MTDLMRELGEAIQDRHYDWMGPTGRDWGLAIAEAALAVPAIADALARDAKVAEIVAKPMGLVLDRAIDLGRIAALYPEAGK